MANKPIISVDAGKLQTIAAGDVGTIAGSINITANAFVGGNLQVEGDIISGGSQNVVVKDQFLDLGVGATTTAQNTGFTFSVKEGSASTTFSAITAGTGIVTVTSAAGFAVGNIIVIVGSSDGANDGLYYISAAAGTSITIDPGAQALAPFLQTAFSSDTTGETGTRLTLVDLAVLAVSNGSLVDQAGGTIPVGTQASAYYEDATVIDFVTTGYTSMSGSSLQSAYVVGQSITVDNSGPGPLAFNANAVGVDTFTAGVGTAFGILTMTANAASLEGASASPGSAKVNVVAGGTAQITEGGANGLEVGATALSLIGTAASIVKDTGNLTIQTTTSGDINLDSVDAFDISGTVDSSMAVIDNSVTDLVLTLGAQNTGTGTANVETVAGDVIKFSTGTIAVPVEQLAISSTNSIFTNQLQASVTNGFQFGAGQNVNNITIDLATSQLVTDLASASAIVAYVGTAIGGTTLLGTADGSTTFSVALDGVATLNILGGSNISTSGAGSTATVALDDAVNVVTSLTVAGTTVITSFIDEDNMASNSDAALPTQQSVKAYVDSRGSANYSSILVLETNGTAIPIGSIVAINSSGNAVLADADATGFTNVIGFALNATTGTGIEPIEIAQVGSLSTIPGTYTAGNELYLSTTAGAATPTPPSGAGETIYRVGTAISTTEVAISLQFIAEVL